MVSPFVFVLIDCLLTSYHRTSEIHSLHKGKRKDLFGTIDDNKEDTDDVHLESQIVLNDDGPLSFSCLAIMTGRRKVMQMSCGSNFGIFVTDWGTVYTMGDNTYGPRVI